MRHIPWITLAVAIVFFVSPPGASLIQQAFLSGEQLSNNIGQFVFLIVLGIVIALAALEWFIKYYLRRAKGATGG